MDVPTTVATALDDRPVSDATCLEAGAGVGNATAGLLAAGADRVYAVTNDPDHSRIVRERVARETPDRDRRTSDCSPDGSDSSPDAFGRTAVLDADVRQLPMAEDAVDVIAAHALFNVVPPSDLDAVASELTRVAAPGCHFVVDDYEPLPNDAEIRELFAVENAASQLADGRPALTFYPSAALRRLFEGDGWTFERERTLLDPVPWTTSHLDAHAAAVRSQAERLPQKEFERFVAEADRLVDAIGEERVGEMYSLALRWPD